ncbi:PIN domain-containing protein [Streptomyces alkaliphilus]|uniref:PIN domain-containing protein n=1 Tax=Streptomyces alkaliphilus TaxID=1472722 RepID=UPI0011800F71|nr:PIN domain-containing protein [Streptomyces alkaliphilus]MQS06577.1 PIN domain-containing protein [Streptomyces alkaliphilus]
MERLILDTGILIGAERGEPDLADLNRNSDPGIAAVTAAELLTGVERADTPQRRRRRQEFADLVFAIIPVEDYTLDIARAHARLLAHVRTPGKPRGAHDLIITATAAGTARAILTTDGKAGFGDLPAWPWRSRSARTPDSPPTHAPVAHPGPGWRNGLGDLVSARQVSSGAGSPPWDPSPTSPRVTGSRTHIPADHRVSSNPGLARRGEMTGGL